MVEAGNASFLFGGGIEAGLKLNDGDLKGAGTDAAFMLGTPLIGRLIKLPVNYSKNLSNIDKQILEINIGHS